MINDIIFKYIAFFIIIGNSYFKIFVLFGDKIVDKSCAKITFFQSFIECLLIFILSLKLLK